MAEEAVDNPQTESIPDSPPAQPTPADVAAQVRTIFRRLGPAGPLAIIAATLPAIGGILLLGLMHRLGPWLETHGLGGLLLYIAIFAGTSGLAILPTYAQAVLGGRAFGFVTGSAAAITGFAGGSVIGYLIARRASGHRVVKLIEERPTWAAVYDALLRSSRAKTLLIVTLLRVPPNSPFAITNLVLAATRVPLPIYLAGTVIGMAPRTAAAAFVGSLLEGYGSRSPYQKWMLVIGIVVLIIVVSIIGGLARQAVTKVTHKAPDVT